MIARNRIGGLVSLAAIVLLAITGSAFASCPNYNPPQTPTLEEARVSQLCVGTVHEARVAELQRSMPEADAKRSVDGGRFKLLATATPFSWDGHICTVSYGDDNTVACSLRPAMQSQSVERDRYHEAFDRIPRLTYPDKAPVSCATVYGRLLADYTGRYNRALVSDHRYPHRDICRTTTPGPQPHNGPLAQPPHQGIQVQPPTEQRPPEYADVAAAARFGDAAEVMRKIAAGQDPSARDEFQLTALDWAVIRGFEPVQEALLAARGAEQLDACTALWYAITFKRIRQADALVAPCVRQLGASAQNARNAVVNLAASRGHAELLSALRAAGADLMAAAPDPQALRAEQVKRNDDLDYLDQVGIGGEEFAMFAASDPGHPEPYTACALHRASAAGHIGIVSDLLDHGVAADAICASIGTQSWWSPKRRALLEAVNHGKMEIVALLLERGAEAGGIDRLPETPPPFQPRARKITSTHLWAQGPPLAQALSQYRGSRRTWPTSPIDMEIVDLLLKHGASPNERGPDGAPAFFSLLWSLTWPPLNADPFNKLHNKLDINARTVEPPDVLAGQHLPNRRLGLVPASGRTLLMEVLLASNLRGEKAGYFGLVPKQIIKGVPPGVPLSSAAHVYRLLGAGADPRLADEAGQSALHYAATLDYGTAAALALIEAGADINARDNAGKTPLAHASARNALKMVAFLKSQRGN